MIDEQKIFNQFESGEITIELDDETTKKLADHFNLEARRAEFEFIKTALEKQIPEKPKEIKKNKISLWTAETVIVKEDCCPRCDKIIGTNDEIIGDYCPYCGQRIDWSYTP